MTGSRGGTSARDVTAILAADHREMPDLAGQIEQAADAGRRRDLADTLISEVIRHAVAEEMYEYPAVEEHVPDGAGMVEHDKEEHQEIVEGMKQIEGLDAAEPAFLEPFLFHNTIGVAPA